jgi:hypothetical protein
VGNDPFVGLAGSGAAGTYYIDGTHLNAAGCKRVAMNVAESIRLFFWKEFGVRNFKFDYGTTDATTKTVKTIPLDANAVYGIKLSCRCRRMTVATEDAYFEKQWEVRCVSGTPTVVSQGTDLVYRNVLTTADVTLVASGANVNIRVTGEAAKTLAWTVQFELSEAV